MLWLKNPGVYFLLNGKGDAGGSLFIVHDPLTVYRDTSAQYVAPAGLYAPVSGFGLVWRGDYLKDNSSWEYEQLLTYRLPLGWATAPESGYQTTYQCGSYTNTVMLKPVYCLLSYPDGRPILIEHSLGSSWGGWKFIK